MCIEKRHIICTEDKKCDSKDYYKTLCYCCNKDQDDIKISGFGDAAHLGLCKRCFDEYYCPLCKNHYCETCYDDFDETTQGENDEYTGYNCAKCAYEFAIKIKSNIAKCISFLDCDIIFTH